MNFLTSKSVKFKIASPVSGLKKYTNYAKYILDEVNELIYLKLFAV